MVLRRTVVRQAQQVYNALRKSLENCPETDMAFADGGLGKLAMHALGSVEACFATPQFQQKWSKPVGTKQELLAYLDDTRQMLLLPFIENQDLLAADAQPQYFISKLDRALKILRHLAHHTGEINAALKAKGIETGPFV
jgi:hypothetical protein